MEAGPVSYSGYLVNQKTRCFDQAGRWFTWDAVPWFFEFSG